MPGLKYYLTLCVSIKLRITLANAYDEIEHEHKNRKHMEEKIRKTFLQGMTTMSLETMQLFNDSSSTNIKSGPFFNAHEQQQQNEVRTHTQE